MKLEGIYLSSGLGNAEEGESQGKKTECSEEDVGAPSDGLEHVRRDKTNDAAKNIRSVLGIDLLRT